MADINQDLLITQAMQNDDIDQIEKTISEYREASFDAMLNRHYTHAAFDSTLLPAIERKMADVI